VISAGTYTLHLSDDGDATTHAISAVGTMTITSKGVAQLTIACMNGERLSFASRVGEDGRLPLFLVRKKETPSRTVDGTLRFQSRGSQSDCEDHLNGLGSPLGALLFGSKFTAPPKGELLLKTAIGAGNVSLGLGSGASPAALVTLTGNAFQKVTTEATSLTGTINRKLGTWTGKLAKDGLKTPATGVVLPRQNRAVGFYRSTTTSGSLVISVPTTK
jgi:hypothetical protein